MVRQLALACTRQNVYYVCVKDQTSESNQKEGWIMRSKRWIERTVIVLAVGLFVGSCATSPDKALRAKFERVIELKHALGPGSQLAVSTTSGSIEITGQETNDVHVTATIVARAATKEDAQELAEKTIVGLEPTANGLELRVGRPAPASKRSVRVDYKIVVPKQTDINSASLSGSIDLTDLHGDISGRTASGAMEVARITGSIHLHSTSGSVRCAEIDHGDVSMESMSGTVHLSEASSLGTCHMGTVSGPVTAKRIEAHSVRVRSASAAVTLSEAQAEVVNLHSVSSRISANDVSCGRLQAESTSGDVSVTFAPEAPGDVAAGAKSNSGSITVVMPRDFAGRVDLMASSGTVRMNQPVEMRDKLDKGHVSGTVGHGSGSLLVRAGSGAIRIR